MTLLESIFTPNTLLFWLLVVSAMSLSCHTFRKAISSNHEPAEEIRTSLEEYTIPVAFLLYAIWSTIQGVLNAPAYQPSTLLDFAGAGIVLVFIGAAIGFPAFLIAYFARYRLTWDDQGITERTLFGTRRFAWGQVDADALARARSTTCEDRQIAALRFAGKRLNLQGKRLNLWELRPYASPIEAFVAMVRRKLDLPMPEPAGAVKNWFR